MRDAKGIRKERRKERASLSHHGERRMEGKLFKVTFATCSTRSTVGKMRQQPQLKRIAQIKEKE